MIVLLFGVAIYTPLSAKRTNIYTEADNIFKNAYDLFSKQKFALAQKQF